MAVVGLFGITGMQAVSDAKKYPWMKVALGYGLLCPALAGMLFITLGYFAQPGAVAKFFSIFTTLFSGERLLDFWGLIVLSLFPLGGIAFFGVPFLILSLFFIGFKVHQGWHAYGFAAGWGSLLGLFMTFGMKPPYAISHVESQLGLAAALSLAVAGLLVTYWVVPKNVESDPQAKADVPRHA